MTSRKRVREPPCRFTDMAPPNKLGRGEFKEEEDAQLLGALLKYGPMDIEHITMMVPTRNEYQVKQRMSVLQKKAQQSLTTVRKEYRNGVVKLESREKVAIDRWLDNLLHLQEKAQIVHGCQEELPVRMLSYSMGLIAKYENHPNPEECGGVDLKNVYKFLENMMLGLPSKNLKSTDARFLIEGLQRLSAKLDTLDLGREKGFIMCGRPQWRSKGCRPRTYGKNDEEPSEEALDFLNSDKFNPFQVPTEWLKKQMELS